jgi:hypothetical protein
MKHILRRSHSRSTRQSANYWFSYGLNLHISRNGVTLRLYFFKAPKPLGGN